MNHFLRPFVPSAGLAIFLDPKNLEVLKLYQRDNVLPVDSPHYFVVLAVLGGAVFLAPTTSKFRLDGVDGVQLRKISVEARRGHPGWTRRTC